MLSHTVAPPVVMFQIPGPLSGSEGPAWVRCDRGHADLRLSSILDYIVHNLAGAEAGQWR